MLAALQMSCSARAERVNWRRRLEDAQLVGEGLPSRYRGIERLGRGAFAIAYRCADTLAGGEVVVKLYELRDRAWSVLTSFEREAAVLAGLSHPAIPRYVEHSQLPDGRLMLVESYAPGRTLAELLGEGRRFSDDEIFDLAEQVLEALEYLQSLNPPIVHRDIKPGNLVLGADGRVRLVDFGSVKEGFRGDGDFASTIVGTYGYMAPEQFQGRANVQSDLYGLGATLVHLLSHIAPSQLPQRGLQLDFHESVKASAGTLAWLDRMLQADPRERFASAKEARVALRERDQVQLVHAARSSEVERRDLPRGSRIVAEHRGDELYVMIPGAGVSKRGVPILTSALFALGFLGVWTFVAARAGGLFTVVSLLGWGVGAWNLFKALFAVCGSTTIRIGPERYQIRLRLFGYERTVQGPTRDLEGVGIARSGKGRSRKPEGCLLHAGVKTVKFGEHLSGAERRWLCDLINERLGIDDEGGELDE